MESVKKFVYADSNVLVQLSGVDSRGRLLNNIKVQCVHYYAFTYDWMGTSFQISFSVA